MVTSTEFFRNMKSIPDKDSREYTDFFNRELEKIRDGVTINGYYFSGWLYWHLNHWKIYMDVEGSSTPVLDNPKLRDNELIIAEHLQRAETEKKGLVIVGSRRITKSVFSSSYSARKGIITKGGQNVVSGLSTSDLQVITKYMDLGLRNLNPYFKFPRIEDDWKKQVTFGYKDKKTNERNEWSTFYVRNFDGGINTEAVAGITAYSFLIDEIGKGPILKALAASAPAFDTPYGWRCSPILTGTGGDFEAGEDAKELFYNPEAYNFLSVEVPNETRKFGLFLSGLYSLRVKKDPMPLAKHLNLPEGSELDDIEVLVTDIEKGTKLLLDKREQASKSNDSTALLKEMMYYPLTPDECFLVDGGNDFPIEAAKQHKEFLQRNNITGQHIWLYRDSDGTVKHSFAKLNEVPITEFPVKKTTIKTAPIQVWEFPVSNPPWNLYVAGADPYNQSSSDYSESLGTVYIYKRMTDVAGENYQDMPVAAYSARPKTMTEWHNNVELLLEWYNAVCFPENEAGTFIQYFDSKNKAHYLADGLNFLREYNPTTSTVSRVKGLAATKKNIEHCMAIMVEYCKEEIVVGVDENKAPIKKLGITRILDPMLLEEIIRYNRDGNFDRIVAFRHALAYSKYLDKVNPVIRVKEPDKKEKEKTFFRTPFFTSSGAFSGGSSLFNLR